MDVYSLALLTAALQSSPQLALTDSVYDGSQGQTSVSLPRMEAAEVRVDGALDEPVWASAAVLSGFTQSEPVEGAPASERTEVLVFYTPTHLYFGVRAFARDASRVRSSVARRDRVQRDDHVQILLDTFNDRRRAFAFYVNPIGIQQDGILNEGGARRRGEGIDFSPDFHFESRGRLTSSGYTVEVRIPLNTLKFSGAGPQTWGVNVVRSIAATGAEEAWAPISRGNPSRLAQSGTLVGLRDLRPGRLLEVNPALTARRLGAATVDGFQHGEVEPDVGVNLKYGLTSNLTLDATVNPDFSQVEADEGQITVNERFAISLQEKRPFFLEGADLFGTPEPLVYTRSIVDPIAGVKLTGKVNAFNLGYLGAVDESSLRLPDRYTPTPQRSIFNIARLQRDVGSGSSVGALVTSRETGPAFNRVAAVDSRIRFGGVYSWIFQGAASWTRSWRPDSAGVDSALVGGVRTPVGTVDAVGHLVTTALDRSGRNWGFRLQARDLPEAFRSHAGFIRRTGLTELFGINRFSWFGGPGALLENRTVFVTSTLLYEGRAFWEGAGPREGSTSIRGNLSFRGNNRIEGGYSNRFFVLDPAAYAGYSLLGTSGDTVRGDALVAPLREMRGLHGLGISASSSYFKTVSAGAGLEWQETPIFAEGTRGRQWLVSGELGLRPTEAFRADASIRYSRMYRERDGSLYSVATVPRLRAEYQFTRALAVRTVLQYTVEDVDVLRAPDGRPYLRSGEPFRLRRGQRIPEDEPQLNPLRLDLLFSYQPSPGTVVFLGYGRESEDAGAFRLGGLEPLSDGLFFKVSYLFRS